jgi:hypothetical protein
MRADATPSTFADRLTEPLTKREWVLLLGIDAITIVGVAAGFLGVVWILIAPTVIAGPAFLLMKALGTPRGGSGRHERAERQESSGVVPPPAHDAS